MKNLGIIFLGLLMSVSAFAENAYVSVAQARNAYASTNVTTSAWVQLVSSLASRANRLEIFDSSGQTLMLGVGGSGSESTILNIIPGGNGVVEVDIAKGARVSLKSITGTASSGEIDVNFYLAR